eukprot:GHVN01040097.1.p1 GENE.GHVN01040097.1~~GHVN01040097.1.p1  ORF type:complete len:256 (-),score=42.54 GHVN01040097.1:190-957(-)
MRMTCTNDRKTACIGIRVMGSKREVVEAAKNRLSEVTKSVERDDDHDEVDFLFQSYVSYIIDKISEMMNRNNRVQLNRLNAAYLSFVEATHSPLTLRSNLECYFEWPSELEVLEQSELWPEKLQEVLESAWQEVGSGLSGGEEWFATADEKVEWAAQDILSRIEDKRVPLIWETYRRGMNNTKFITPVMIARILLGLNSFQYTYKCQFASFGRYKNLKFERVVDAVDRFIRKKTLAATKQSTDLNEWKESRVCAE